VTVKLACEVIGNQRTPLNGFSQFQHVFLQQLQDGPKLELGIAQEAKEQFHGTVACSPAKAGHGGVSAIATEDDYFNRIGESQLLIVVGVNANLLIGADIRLGEFFKRLINLGLGYGGDGHEIAGGFIAHFVSMLYHFHRFGNLIDVTGYADDVEDALIARFDLRFPVALAGVGHGGEFEAGLFSIVVAYDPAHVLLVAVAPRAELVPREQSRGVLVADFHVIEPSSDAGVIYGPDDLVGELVVVDEPAVADGAVEHFKLRAVCDLGSGIVQPLSFPLMAGKPSIAAELSQQYKQPMVYNARHGGQLQE